MVLQDLIFVALLLAAGCSAQITVVGFDAPNTHGPYGDAADPRLALGEYHTCAQSPDGLVYCWGGNGSGQLGDGTKMDHLSPTTVMGLSSSIIRIAAGPLQS